MIKRTCTMLECNRAHVARGYCKAHYNQLVDTTRHAKKLVPCTWCGTEVLRHSGGGRKYGPACSDQCRQYLATPYCILPSDHWARWYGKSSEWKPRKPKVVPKIKRECEWCGAEYETHQSQSKYCADRCAKKASKLRRRAREHNAPGSYTWAQVIRLHLLADRRCSYCDEHVAQPEPDHVVPISRSGRNDISNILPCCQRCNGDKGDMTLAEWAEYRARHNKPAVRTSFDYKDQRFTHLILGAPTGQSRRLVDEMLRLAA